jgi:hypothetical protein
VERDGWGGGEGYKKGDLFLRVQGRRLRWNCQLFEGTGHPNIFNNYWFYFPAFQVISPQGKQGEVEVTVKVAGYNQNVLDAAQIKDAVSFSSFTLSIHPSLIVLF